ncbi:hypothetical protein BLA29_012401 [Euroglyphus maynei]|uniref:Uncharacterized protein n=1 Tax=Euroglyphus maynei TaxID=6958 RepID=A0A1Y3B5H2_EURMA|nr:hypothetical protein BLA29_012401 [Euroglyphus maynei]
MESIPDFNVEKNLEVSASSTQKTQPNEYSINDDSNENTKSSNNSSLIDEIDTNTNNNSCILNLSDYNIPMEIFFKLSAKLY